MYKKLLLCSALCLLISPAIADETFSPEGNGGKKGGHFKAADTDGNGEIDKAEFLAQAEKRFEKLDKDNSGSLSQDELKGARKHRKGKRSQHSEE
tara:strand:- start:1102 stop:1386 length:285 start_codon:yes stop_codon:yes gene_type:complete